MKNLPSTAHLQISAVVQKLTLSGFDSKSQIEIRASVSKIPPSSSLLIHNHQKQQQPQQQQHWMEEQRERERESPLSSFFPSLSLWRIPPRSPFSFSSSSSSFHWLLNDSRKGGKGRESLFLT